MYFGHNKELKIKQLIAPAIPLWAEYEDPDGIYELPGCQSRGWSEPVVALALVEDYSNHSADNCPEENVEALVVTHNDNIEPISMASSMANFRGLSILPPVRISK